MGVEEGPEWEKLVFERQKEEGPVVRQREARDRSACQVWEGGLSEVGESPWKHPFGPFSLVLPRLLLPPEPQLRQRCAWHDLLDVAVVADSYFRPASSPRPASLSAPAAAPPCALSLGDSSSSALVQTTSRTRPDRTGEPCSSPRAPHARRRSRAAL